MSYKDLFTGDIKLSLKTAASVLSAYPASALALTKIAKGLHDAERRRTKLAKDNFNIPPLVIVSTTEECNLTLQRSQEF